MDERIKLLKELTEASGVPGFEHEVRAIIRKHMEDFTCIEEDRLGSIICKKEGPSDGPKVMLSAHMDEIGFMVKHVTEEGFIKFQTLGGWWEQVMLAQRVIIKTNKGDVPGVIGSIPPHILDNETRNKVVKKENMFIDCGAKDKEEAEKVFGIRPGDPIIPVSEFTVMANPDLFMAKAFDDRLGCAMFIEVMKELKGTDHPNTVYGVGTVQEEVGLRGAKTSVNKICPDIAFALEVGIASDVPGTKDFGVYEKLGEGPVILVYDASMIPNRGLRDFVINVAEEMEIPYQLDSLAGGGTDAGAIHIYKEGVPSLVIAVPTRYIHTHVGIIHRKDYENAIKLLKEVIMRLDSETVAKFTL
ncbi:peptidase M28 [Anoxybacter fermentans]|uniref:Peptidase M28 n=1 Tax=Anoxybacter fermentans TaxID=1323375 RepID=A0A3S9SWQ8_9FIRM|nr:M42 family metallopeptidase [Anoxybacter fermentans]AZR72776.1 peptidase M28 [Anoxybacter fermentans]